MDDDWVPRETQDLPWFHGDLTRAAADVLLDKQPPGTYLLRKGSKPKQLVFVIRCDDSTKHTVLKYENSQYKYGTFIYKTIAEFDAFLVAGKTLKFSNFSVVCREPFLRDSFYDTPHDSSPVPQQRPKPGFGDVRPPLPLPRDKPSTAPKPSSLPHGPKTPTSPCNHSTCPDPEKHANVIEELGWMMGKPPPPPRRMDSPDRDVTAQTDDVTQQMSATSLQEPTNVADVLKIVVEGYLTKQGGKVKNWKHRWVSVSGTTLRYYKKRDDGEPLKIIDLQECSECAREHSLDKDFCFRLVLQSRTFYFVSSCEEECSRWLDAINKKMDILKRTTAVGS